MKRTIAFLILGNAFFIATILSCSGGGRVSSKTGQDGLVTKSTFKKGVRYERDFINGKLTETRVYYGTQLAERYPIFKEFLQTTRISLRSGNNFFTKEGIDTLDVINPDIPPDNFGFKVRAASILSRVQHGVYVLKYSPSRNPERDTIKVWIQVLQPQNKLLGTGSFVSDSAIFQVH